MTHRMYHTKNVQTFWVYQYCPKMWSLRSLEHASVMQKLTILEHKNGLVLSNTHVPVSGTWSILFPSIHPLSYAYRDRNSVSTALASFIIIQSTTSEMLTLKNFGIYYIAEIITTLFKIKFCMFFTFQSRNIFSLKQAKATWTSLTLK